MNITLINTCRRTGLYGLAAVLAIMLGGCLEQCVVWSPDGKRAVVMVDGELRLCGPDGKLGAVSVESAYRVAWSADSQQLVVATAREAKDWASVAQELGREKAAEVEVAAEQVWQKISAGNFSKLTEEIRSYRVEPVILCLRDHHGEELRARVNSSEWDVIEKQTEWIHRLSVARMEGERVIVGATLHHGLGRYNDLRISPDGRFVALTFESFVMKEHAFSQLLVVPVAGAEAVAVADRVAGSPDWTADGRAVVYMQASGIGVDKDDLLLGALTRRGVLDGEGNLKVAAEATPLAGALFGDTTRVRCLRDGRMIFNAAEITLPLAAEDFGGSHQQLFALDPARQSTLVRLVPRKLEDNLPKELYFFEVSPDEKQVVIGSYKGEVTVVTLASGAIQTCQTESTGDNRGVQGAPVWRADGAITYIRRVGDQDGKKPVRKVEVVVRRGDKEEVLSASWPDVMVNKLYSEK